MRIHPSHVLQPFARNDPDHVRALTAGAEVRLNRDVPDALSASESAARRGSTDACTLGNLGHWQAAAPVPPHLASHHSKHSLFALRVPAAHIVGHTRRVASVSPGMMFNAFEANRISFPSRIAMSRPRIGQSVRLFRRLDGFEVGNVEAFPKCGDYSSRKAGTVLMKPESGHLYPVGRCVYFPNLFNRALVKVGQSSTLMFKADRTTSLSATSVHCVGTELVLYSPPAFLTLICLCRAPVSAIQRRLP
jgi:hypothetical protein